MYRGGDFWIPVGISANSVFTDAVHGRYMVRSVPRDMGRVGMNGEGT